ncbi:MAG: hypothetical protein SGI72_13705 [Planctomycetota bacterium]|nr:hypothetical protein [Planctomycetota bacterium]
MVVPGTVHSVVLPGDEQTTADWIPPGAYVVRVESREFALIEAPVRIHSEDTAELRLRLELR